MIFSSFTMSNKALDDDDDDDCGSLDFAPETMEFNRPPENTYSTSTTTASHGMLGDTNLNEAPKDTGSGAGETNEDKKHRRIMANRRSAKESRERRKHLLSKLQATVDVLSAENRSLNQENGQLRDQIQDLKQQLMLANAMAGRTSQPITGGGGGVLGGGGLEGGGLGGGGGISGMNHPMPGAVTNTAPSSFDHQLIHQQQMMQQLQQRQQQLLLSSSGGSQRSSGLSQQNLGDLSHNLPQHQQQQQHSAQQHQHQQQDFLLAAALQRARDQHPF